MRDAYPNTLGSERTVEVLFLLESLKKYNISGMKWLDIGGIPSDPSQMQSIYEFIQQRQIDYRISDFRGGHYQGNFISHDFKGETFDCAIFLSSLEHFPQCTEGPDMIYREGEDERGFKKALSILNDGGLVFLTVPFGKQRWQSRHQQTYDLEGILSLTKGAQIIEQYIYSLDTDCSEGEKWVLTDPSSTRGIVHDSRVYACAQFVLRKT